MTAERSKVLEPGSGQDLGAIGLGILVKLTGEQTRGAYSLFEYVVPPTAGGPPTHIHSREDELFICTAGEITVELGEDTHVLREGDVLLMPHGIPHMFYNRSDKVGRITAVVSPPGLENYYRELSELPPGPRDMKLVGDVMRRHGLSLVEK